MAVISTGPFQAYKHKSVAFSRDFKELCSVNDRMQNSLLYVDGSHVIYSFILRSAALFP